MEFAAVITRRAIKMKNALGGGKKSQQKRHSFQNYYLRLD
jgi:hypothetical protein